MVEQRLKKLTPDEKIGQLIVPSFESNFLSTDSDTFETKLCASITSVVFTYSSVQPAPSVLLNPNYGTVILGRPFSAAFDQSAAGHVVSAAVEHRRLRDRCRFPHFGATSFPRQMATGAIPGRTARLAREGKRITALESRALACGNSRRSPMNSNAQPVINPVMVRTLSDRGARRRVNLRARRADDRHGQHFPGRRHRRRQPSGLPIVTLTGRDSTASSSCRPSRRSRAPRVMAAHVVLPALTQPRRRRHVRQADSTTCCGRKWVSRLVYTDSMSMDAVAKMVPPDEGAVRAMLAVPIRCCTRRIRSPRSTASRRR